MKRHRACALLDKEAVTAENSDVQDTALNELKDSSAGTKTKKRFVGVRQRPSGRWVAEIKDTTQKIRLWLGTFDSAEEGAKAYDSAARALRGANTRTNFVPAVANEGTVPASKAARLIRLRQIAAASKACENEPPNVTQPQEQNDPNLGKIQDEGNDRLISTPKRQDIQPSSNLRTALGDNPPHLPSSPRKPARLISHRSNAPSVNAKPEQEGDAPLPVITDRGAVDCDLKVKVGDFLSPHCSSSKLEPQQSITSENLSTAINRSLTVSPQDPPTRPSSPPSLSSFRIPFDGMQPISLADGDAHLVNSGLAEAAATDLKFNKQTIFPTQIVEEWQRLLSCESYLALAVDNFMALPPISLHVAPLEASMQLFRSDHNVSDFAASTQHGGSSQHHIPCTTNRDLVTIYPPARYSDLNPRMSNGNEIPYRASVSRQVNSDDAMSMDASKSVTETKCCKPASTVPKEEINYGSAEIHGVETERIVQERYAYREKEFPELLVLDHMPWSEYGWGDETGMESGLLGLNLSSENSEVYTPAFDFSAETIDRDSCTNVPSRSNSFQECVELTKHSELDYSMSPHESSLSSPQLSPPATHLSMSSSDLWSLNDTSAWDGQSSGSTETITSSDIKSGGDGNGECTSQDHEALWSSMDLPPLCMVA